MTSEDYTQKLKELNIINQTNPVDYIKMKLKEAYKAEEQARNGTIKETQ